MRSGSKGGGEMSRSGPSQRIEERDNNELSAVDVWGSFEQPAKEARCRATTTARPADAASRTIE